MLEGAITEKQEWQHLAESVREACETVNPFLLLVRRGTQIDVERIIAVGLNKIPEGPSPEGQAVENMDELVASYRDVVRIDDVGLTTAR